MGVNVTQKILKANTDKWSLAYAQAPSVILNLYNNYPENKLFFHNFSYSSELVSLVENLGGAHNVSDGDLLKAEICAWFYSSGRLIDYLLPAKESNRLLNSFLNDQGIEVFKEEIFQDTIKPLKEDPEWLIILKDAILAQETGLNGRDVELKRLQDDFNLPAEWIASEWEYFKFQQLLETRFVTEAAKLKFEELLAKRISFQKSQLERLGKGDKKKSDESPKNVSARRLQANIQNYIRVSFRNHIELTKMADNRAHIMISVNSILTGVLISYISYQNLPETQPKLLIPVIVFMITSLTSLIFAILCARPRTIRSISKDSNESIIKDNIASFSNFTMLSQIQYEDAMDAVFTDNKLMLGNLTKELYQTGKILDIKFKYLGFSYNIFMFGFVACVILFMAVFMMN